MKESTNFDINRQTWWTKTGKLPVPMTNDYMFKAVCQKDETALRSLICAVLHIEAEDIKSIRVCNPILPGKAIDEKEYILDTKVELNNQIMLDLELQVINYKDWPDRSLQYLCRMFDTLHRGDQYKDTQGAMHIGILNFKLHEDSRLLESYLLMDSLTHRLYTNKFQLHILTLPKADVPGEEDVRYHTDVWARYFAATTWEDLKMLAEKDEGIASAIETTQSLWEEDDVRARAIARDDFIRRQKTQQAALENAEDRLAKAEARITQAEDRASQAEDRATQAEDRASQAEDRASQAEDRASQAEDRASQAEDRASQAEDRASQAENRAAAAEEELRRLREELKKYQQS